MDENKRFNIDLKLYNQQVKAENCDTDNFEDSKQYEQQIINSCFNEEMDENKSFNIDLKSYGQQAKVENCQTNNFEDSMKCEEKLKYDQNIIRNLVDLKQEKYVKIKNETDIKLNIEKFENECKELYTIKNEKKETKLQVFVLPENFNKIKKEKKESKDEDENLIDDEFENCTENTDNGNSTISKDEKTYFCAHCDYKSTHRLNFTTHLRIHRQPSKCPHCDYVSAKTYTLRRHIKTHKRVQRPSRFQCSLCKTKFKFRKNLVQHTKIHLGDTIISKDEKTYFCAHCDYKSTNRSNFATHLHIHRQPSKCPHCDYVSVKTYTLNNHIKTHKGVHRPSKYQCSLCKTKFTCRYNLVRHSKIHLGDRSFKCSYCSFCCTSRYILNNHILTHTRERPFQCPQCDFSSGRKYSLKNHMFRHTGEHPFKCSYCKVGFASHSALKDHQIFRHDQEAVWKCTTCDFTSTLRADLKKHKTEHPGHRPLRCEHCDYGCYGRKQMEKHLKSHIKFFQTP